MHPPTDMARCRRAQACGDPDQRKRYDLIWKRTLACQMEPRGFERTTVESAAPTEQVGLRAAGRSCLRRLPARLRRGPDAAIRVDDDDDKRLPRSDQGPRGSRPKSAASRPNQHFTQPPPRYTEATLVKRMEELGIGRPSTYASIVTTIQDREYVRKDRIA